MASNSATDIQPLPGGSSAENVAFQPSPESAQVGLASRDEEDSGIRLLYYWHVVLKHKWKVLSVAFLVTLGTAMHLSTLIPMYQATAVLLIEQSKAKVVSIENVYSADYSSQSYMQTQIELMKSRHLVEEVVRQERLDLAPEFNPKHQKKRKGWSRDNWIPKWLQAYLPPAPEAPPVEEAKPASVDADEGHFANLVNVVNSRITVAPVRNSQLVNISFISESPELAAKVATTVAQVYIDQMLEARLKMTQNAANWLMKRLEGLRHGLEESERKLQEFRSSSDMLGSTEEESMETQLLSSLNNKLMQAHSQRTETQVRYERLQALMEEYKDHLEDLPLKDNPMVDNLLKEASKVSMQLSELSSRYGEKHPQILRAKTELADLKKKVSQEVNRAVAAAKHDYSIAATQESKAEQQLEEQKNRLQTYQKKVFILGNMEREVQANRQLYELFQKRFKETGVSEGMEAENARIVDPAKPPASSFTPNKRRSLSMAIVVGLLLGILLAILLENMDRTIQNPEDLELSIGLPILATLPKLHASARRPISPEGMMINQPRSPYAEAVRAIRTGLVLTLDQPPQVITVTSTTPQEGKTTVSINLTRAFHLAGERVLLIEADMRKPRMNKYFKLDLEGNINNLLTDLNHWQADGQGTSVAASTGPPTAEEIQAVRREITQSRDGIHLLICETHQLNPSEALASKKWSRTMAVLRQEYQRIIVDSPPVLAVTDARILSTLSDGVVFVVMAGRTQRNLVRGAIQQMTRVNARLLGLVLNTVDTKKMMRYGGKQGYGGGYGYGYGYGYGTYGSYGDAAVEQEQEEEGKEGVKA
ncbi:MAG: AAA family ATPase [Magnetococcales bacterium]|nr:AAA family ATPase [Magnetococcales bacterium]